MTKYYCLITLLLLFKSIHSFSQTIPCENGFAGSYPCSNINLISRLTTDDLLAEEEGGILVNDIWGWTDPDTGKEYVIVGMANGTSFVDISDPENPLMLGILPEHHQAGSHKMGGKPEHGKSIWRDIKVYQNHAFIVSEDEGHGMQVFDLTDLRNVLNTPTEFLEAGHYNGISNAHNIVINEETGYAYAVGATGSSVCNAGGLHVINISDPKNPIYEACYDEDGYTHDAQCVIYNGPDVDYQGKEVCFNSNEDTITIVNVDDKNNIQLISRTGYDQAFYTHQGWLTEDHKYFLSNDELDELNSNVNTNTLIWNVEDLDNPILLGRFNHTTRSIDHNLYIVGNEVYESNYTSGLRVLDKSNIAEGELVQLGYFDTYPINNAVEFNGTWSNYPFFESGIIAVSDITNGLFLLKLNDVIKTEVTRQPSDINACIGEHFDMMIDANGKDLSYRWQIDKGSGFEDITDYVAYNNTFSKSLHIHQVNILQNGYKFRCKISSSQSQTIYTESATLNITESPLVDFDYTYDESTVNFNNLTLFGLAYEWNFGDGSDLNSSVSPQHLYDKKITEYDVTLKANNKCGVAEITKSIAFVVTGNTEISTQEVKVFPNPSSSYLIILHSNDNLSKYSIYNLSGTLINSGSLIGNETKVNIETYQKGLYILELTNEKGERSVQKFIIE